MRVQSVTFFCIAILLTLILINSCSDSTDPDPPEDEEITVTLNPVDSESGNLLSNATHYDDASGDVIGVGNADVTRDKDNELSVRTENDGHETATTDITFSRNKEVDISLTAKPPEDPDSVTITYSVHDDAGDPVNTAELSVADTLVASGASGSFDLPYSDSETVNICGDADWHENDCAELTPDADQEIELILSRATVSISVTPEIIGYTDLYANNSSISTPTLVVNNTIYHLSVGDSTKSGAGRAASSKTEIAEGVTTTIEYPAGPDPVPVSLRVEYFPEEGHEYSDEYYLNVAEGATEVAGNAGSDIQLDLEHIPACSDGVDNEFTGVMDEDAPGCIDYGASTSHEVGTAGWVYDPDDDVELLQIASSTGLFGGNDTISVSSAEGNRTVQIGGRTYDKTFALAIGPIDLFLKNKIESDQDGEAFAVKYICGDTRDTRADTTGITDIIPDDASLDGWRTTLVIGVDASFFDSGLSCGRYAFHASKVSGDPPGDGDDDVIFADPDTFGYVKHVRVFEPEMVAEAMKTAASFSQQETVGDIQIQDVRMRDPRDAVRRLDLRNR